MSETENPPLDPADPPANQGGGTNANQTDASGSDIETDDARTADPPVQQPGGG